MVFCSHPFPDFKSELSFVCIWAGGCEFHPDDENWALWVPRDLSAKHPRRRHLSAGGRYAAAEALRGLGHECRSPLKRLEGGNPEWPDGYVGSISHAEAGEINLVAAIAGDGLQWRGLGIDIESTRRAKVIQSLSRRILNDGDRSADMIQAVGKANAHSLIFSAKESLYKALYPTVKRYFGFDAASVVEIDPSCYRFRIRLQKPWADDLPTGSEWWGEYRLAPGWVATWLAIPRTDAKS